MVVIMIKTVIMKNKMNIWINARNGHKGVKRKKPCL